MIKSSIIIPVFNESETIIYLIEKLLTLSIDIEIILIDDGSTDASRALMRSLNHPDIRLLYHSQRSGKGAAVQTGLQAATGDIVVIQDADLEYNPNDIIPLIRLIEHGKTDVVYGMRDLSQQKFIIRLGNKFLTWATNKIYRHSIVDMNTCYKVMSRKLMEQLGLESKGFAIDAEITAKLFRLGGTIDELPVRYNPRYKNKKLKIRDGIPMMWALLKYRFWTTSLHGSSVRQNATEIAE